MLRFVQGWIVTKCGQFMGPKLRKKYADELAKYLPSMERYVTCITGNRFPESRMGSFLQSKKFYLAFENSLHCKGYITEKFYHSSLAYRTVPVVWGSRKKTTYKLLHPIRLYTRKTFHLQKNWQNIFYIWIQTTQLTVSISDGAETQRSQGMMSGTKRI